MKHLKRFISISLLAALALPATACMWTETHNYYLFSVYDRQEFRDRVNEVSLNNWKAYLGISGDDYFYFDADRIGEAARQKGDQLMADYVAQLERYLECVHVKEREQYEWDYPTAQERQDCTQKLLAIRTYAQGKLTTRLRSQHALLLMRCNMMLGRHGENVNFWEQTASKYIETVYKDMMQNIYAGALLKTGRSDRAGQLFAAQGDWQSLMTQFYKKRSFAAIKQEYQRDPQSAVLPFLLQDFVNNCQEAVDQDGFGKLFVRDIQRSEAQQMIQLAAQAAREAKTQYPVMWMSAKAWLEFMYDNRMQALADIKKAVTLDGTERMKDCARVLQFYITAMQSPTIAQQDDYVAAELQWLDQKRDANDYYANAQDRIAHQALFTRYAQAGRDEAALALYKAVHQYHDGEALDTISTAQLQRFMDYAKSTPTTALDKYLKKNLELDEAEMNDLMGTKHLRLCQWQQAIDWLQRVPLDYYQQQGYAVFAAHRSVDVEPWITRQWLKDEDYEDGRKLQANPKLDFARQMMSMEKELQKLKGQKRQQRCFDLAVRYAQAHFTGDCWYLMRSGKSVLDELRANETDLAARARQLLTEASQSSDFRLKERALFALSYIYLYNEPWWEYKWNPQLNDDERVARPQTAHYRAWKALYQLEQANAAKTSDYVQRCDEYIQFRKQMR